MYRSRLLKIYNFVMEDSIEKSSIDVEEGSKEVGSDRGRSWISNVDCLEEREGSSTAPDEREGKRLDDRKNSNHGDDISELQMLEDVGNEEEFSNGPRQHYSVRPFNRLLCCFVIQKVKRFSMRMNIKNRQEKQPLLLSASW